MSQLYDGEMRQGPEKERLLKLTLAVYRVTAFFPTGEELGLKIRDLADKILVLLLELHECSRAIMDILGLFDLAEKKNWVDSRNFSVLRREYEYIRQCFAPPQDGNRQDKILAVLSGNGRVKIGDLVSLFPGVNRRTVLRDLDMLCQSGVMVRNGSGRGVFYVNNGHKNETMSQ